MKTKYYVAAFVGLAVLALIIIICLPKKTEEVAPAQVENVVSDNEVIRAEVKSAIDGLTVINKEIITVEERVLPENSATAEVFNCLYNLEKKLKIKFYSPIITPAKQRKLSSESLKHLTSKNPKAMPFYYEDDKGTIYFAPAAEQQYIISQWHRWYDKFGENFDYTGMNY